MADREIDFPMTEFDQFVEGRLLDLKGQIRHCFRNAYVHIKKSWLLHHVDNEMSLLRAITAEEEAATAVILAIKERQYPGSKKFKERNHTHKAVVFPVVQAVNNLLSEMPDLPTATLHITKTGKPEVHIRFEIPFGPGETEPVYGMPDNPLNFGIKVESSDGFSNSFLEDNIRILLTDSKFADFNKMIVDQANRRNQLLYASNAGYPTVQFEDSLIIEKHSRVRELGLLTIAILQDKTQQILVRQCIEIVLSKLDNLTPTGYDYELPEANFQF